MYSSDEMLGELSFSSFFQLFATFELVRLLGLNAMTRSYLLVILTLLLPCCASRPIQTIMRGNMNMDGNMNMNGQMRMEGDMNMNGDMNMSGEVSTVMRTDNTASRLASVPVYSTSPSPDQKKIVVIDVDGLMVNKNIGGLGSMGENPVALFREKLDAVAMDGNVGAIVLRINSQGGGVTATDMMTRDLNQLKSQLGVPVVACLMDVGTGGAYYLATAADRIVAHPTSVVGGVGVILNVYRLDEALQGFSIYPIPIKSGEKIDIASPSRTMEEDERAMLQTMADSFHQRFIDRVTATRQLQSDAWFDGRVITGIQAEEAGLVDAVGYLDDAVVAARTLADLPATAPVEMLRRDNDRAHTLLDVTPNSPTMSSLIPLNIPGLDRSKLPTFLYMWQPEPSAATAAGG